MDLRGVLFKRLKCFLTSRVWLDMPNLEAAASNKLTVKIRHRKQNRSFVFAFLKRTSMDGWGSESLTVRSSKRNAYCLFCCREFLQPGISIKLSPYSLFILYLIIPTPFIHPVDVDFLTQNILFLFLNFFKIYLLTRVKLIIFKILIFIYRS